MFLLPAVLVTEPTPMRLLLLLLLGEIESGYLLAEDTPFAELNYGQISHGLNLTTM